MRAVYDTGVEIPIMGYDSPELWSYQREQNREAIEQAAGRARALREDVDVYVFCNFPVRCMIERMD